VGFKELQPIGAGHKVLRHPHILCTGTKYIIRLATPYTLLDSYSPQMYNNCVCNQVVAYRNRVMGATPDPTIEGLRQLSKARKLICKFLPKVSQLPLDAITSRYSGRKKDRYTKAYHELISEGLTRRDAQCTLMVKGEKLDPLSKSQPDPRAIQFRRPKYCVAIAQFLHACEHLIYNMRGDGVRLPRSRLIGKGLNARERGKLFYKKWQSFKAPVVIGLDASRFDKHVNVPLLREEHAVYQYMLDNPEFRKLLSWQERNTVSSRDGVKYVVAGKRMSGDMNTALGNCLLMIIMCVAAAKAVQLDSYDLLDDGDDILLFAETKDLELIKAEFPRLFLTYGMTLKIECVSREPEQVLWCQSRPILIDSKYVFVRDPKKVMSNALTGTKYFHEQDRRPLVNTIGMAELVINLGVPILQEFALALIRNAGSEKILNFDPTDDLWYRLHRELRELGLKHLIKVNPRPITDDARLSFAKAYKIEPHVQIYLEDRLRSWVFLCEGETLDTSFHAKSWCGLTGPDVYHLRDSI